MNVLREDLTGSPADAQLFDPGSFPLHPHPLIHGHLPVGLRTAAIDALCSLLRRQSPVTVCVLAYDAETADGKIVRLVLDGNRRLAAARRIFAEWIRSGSIQPVPVRVLAFLMSETKKIDTRVCDGDVPRRFLPWWGFTPYITLLYGHQYGEGIKSTDLPSDAPTVGAG